MICINCGVTGKAGDRYCAMCGEYLSVKPGPAHFDLLQFSPDDFVETVAEGLPLIWNNANLLWHEAEEIAQVGDRRAVGIIESIAEEEAAKALLLFDVIRCPISFPNKRSSLLKLMNQHIAKGIYARYYSTSPADMAEVKRIVSLERQAFFRDGEYGEYVFPNSITSSREARLYVTYIRHDDDTHEWSKPFGSPMYLGSLHQSGILRVVEALNSAGLFLAEALKAVHQYWTAFPFLDVGENPVVIGPNELITWRQLTEINFGMLKTLQERRLLASTLSENHQRTLVHELLFPLYPFDLSLEKNFAELPPPDWQESY